MADIETSITICDTQNTENINTNFIITFKTQDKESTKTIRNNQKLTRRVAEKIIKLFVTFKTRDTENISPT